MVLLKKWAEGVAAEFSYQGVFRMREKDRAGNHTRPYH
jgi:hypothetical protein